MSFFLNAVYKHDFVWGFVSLLLHTGVIFRSIFCQAGEYILQSIGKKGGIFLLRKLEQLYLNLSVINVRNLLTNNCVNSAMNSSKILTCPKLRGGGRFRHFRTEICNCHIFHIFGWIGEIFGMVAYF